MHSIVAINLPKHCEGLMVDAFSNILGQPKVRDFLRACVESERVTHAYLFVGPSGSNKTQAAYSLAQAVLCPKGGSGPKGGFCNSCDNCKRVSKRTHPDVHYYCPEGAGGYLIEQIRQMVSDIALSPILASKKIYIIDRADLLGHSAANALLKTLEEPPDDAVLILLGRTRESMLETIASRCQIVPFRHIPPSEAAGIIAQNTGADVLEARRALEACNGSITRAISFLSSNRKPLLRKKILSMLGNISEMNDWEILKSAREVIETIELSGTSRSTSSAKGASLLDEIREKQETELQKNQDFLDKSAIRRIEERNKRQLSKESMECMKEAFSVVASWLRDLEVASVGCTELIINDDFSGDILRVCSNVDSARLSLAIRSLDEAKAALDYNVSPETCFDAVLFEVRGIFDEVCYKG